MDTNSNKNRPTKNIWDVLDSLYEPTYELVSTKKEEPQGCLASLFGPPKQACPYCGTKNSKKNEVCDYCFLPMDGGNRKKISFPKDLWDYLEDMPYMPDRADRDKLIKQEEDGKHVQIWDYFFRINPDDVGKPQRYCIGLLKKYLQTIDELSDKAKHSGSESYLYRKQIDQNKSKLKNLLFRLQPEVTNLNDININRWTKLQQIKEQVEAVIQRLEREVRELQKQINILVPPSDQQVFAWLQDDLEKVKRQTLEKAGIENVLATRQFRIEDQFGSARLIDNPLTFISPGQLQDFSRIPEPYRPYPEEVVANAEKFKNLLELIPVPDRAKHLLARRVGVIDERPEIIFGVYYIEHFCVGEHMLIQYSFFYDFINGKVFAEDISEHYYQEIVSIRQSKEFRRIPLDYRGDRQLEIENTPVFRISFTNGYSHSITFMNEEFFDVLKREEMIKEMLGAFSDLLKGVWRSEQVSETEEQVSQSAIQVLRQKLRMHKELIKAVEVNE